ncbi:MAG: MFS transporter [Caulobacteraceae bacterium]|nr:MFS transporter [Caulobacteraceae bacterium]
MSSPSAGAKPLSLFTILCFSGTSLPLGALAIALAVYLPPYFASQLGVSLAVVGGAFATVRLLDLAVDFALGIAMDRTKTRWGRYRVWTLIGTPFLMAALYMLFMAPQGIGIGYIITWLLVMYLGTSILGLSHSAWAGTLATNYDQRSRIFGIMAAVGVVGAITVLLVPIIMEAMGRSEGEGVRAMGWFIIGLTPLAIFLIIWRTPETVTRNVDNAFRWKDYLTLMVRPNVIRLLLADLCLALGPGWMSALYLFFFRDSLGFTTGQATNLLGVYIVAGFFGAPLISRLAMRVGKHRSLAVTTTVYSLGLCCLMLVKDGNFLLALPIMFSCGFMAAGFQLLTRAMTADIADEIRLDQGQERLGLLYALTTLTSKIAGAFAIGLTFTVLEQVGYQAAPGAVNTAEAITSLEWAYLLGPIVFVMLGGACFWGYKLNAIKHGEIRAALEERDRQLAEAAGQYDEAPILESVSGEPATLAPGSPRSRLT